MRNVALLTSLLFCYVASAIGSQAPSLDAEIQSTTHWAEANWLTVMAKANSGNKESQYLVGESLLFGLYGISKNATQALGWYLLSAEQGFAESQYRVGAILLFGSSGQVDFPAARHWLEKANDGGSVNAEDLLGTMYISGQGGPQDLETGVELFKHAMRRGSADAKLHLSICYEVGSGVPLGQDKGN